MNNFRTRAVGGPHAKFREGTSDTGEPITIITSLITNKSVDGHGTHMSEDSIDRISKAENVTLLDSHNHQTTGYGTSIRIWRDGDDVFGDFAILDKARWSNLMTYTKAEHLLYELRHRPGWDTSLGFGNDLDICDLCVKIDNKERDIWWDEDCEHWLNDLYDVEGESEKLRATAELRGAEIYENSLVFAGSNYDSHIVSESQRKQVLIKSEHLIKKGVLSHESLMRAAAALRIPELRTVGKSSRNKVFIPDKKRSKSTMPKTTEALESRIEELEEELEESTEGSDEIKELYDAERLKVKSLKAEVKALKTQLSILEDLEDELREQCRAVAKKIDELSKEDDRMTEEEQSELETELEEASYNKLKTKLKSLEKQRDIVIEINKVNTGDDDVTDIPDDDDSVTKPVQPFMAPGELDNRYFQKSD